MSVLFATEKTNGVTNMDSSRLSETEPPTKEHTQAGPRPPCTYVVDVQLGLHVSPK